MRTNTLFQSYYIFSGNTLASYYLLAITLYYTHIMPTCLTTSSQPHITVRKTFYPYFIFNLYTLLLIYTYTLHTFYLLNKLYHNFYCPFSLSLSLSISLSVFLSSADQNLHGFWLLLAKKMERTHQLLSLSSVADTCNHL